MLHLLTSVQIFIALITNQADMRTHRFYEDGSVAIYQSGVQVAGTCAVPQYGCTVNSNEPRATLFEDGSVRIELNEGSYGFCAIKEWGCE
jgi:hypothetical protein